MSKGACNSGNPPLTEHGAGLFSARLGPLRRYPVEDFATGLEKKPRQIAWHCSCGQFTYGGFLWAVGHWLRHLHRSALGRCFYCGNPECED